MPFLMQEYHNQKVTQEHWQDNEISPVLLLLLLLLFFCYYYYYHTGKTTEWSPIQSVIMQHRTSVKLCKMQRYIDQLNSRKL